MQDRDTAGAAYTVIVLDGSAFVSVTMAMTASALHWHVKGSWMGSMIA